MSPMSEGRKEYLYNYQKEKLKRVALNLKKDKYEEVKAAADATGESVSGYIKKAVDIRLDSGK